MIQYHEIDTSEWTNDGRGLPSIEVLFPRIDDNVISVGRCFRLEPHIILDNEELVFIAYVLTIDGNDKAVGMCLTRTETKWIHVDAIPDMIKSKKAISINDFDDYLKDLSRRMKGHGP